MTFQPSPNPDATGNIRRGRQAYARGLRTPESVFEYHLGWNRGAAAETHFRNGYWEAAQADGMPRAEQFAATSFVDPTCANLTTERKICRLKIMRDFGMREWGRSPAQWQLDHILVQQAVEAGEL